MSKLRMLALWGVLAALVLPAWVLSARADEATKIRLGYGITSDYLPAFVAQDNGIFARHGLDVTMVVVTSSSLAPPALVSGSLQISQATPPNLLLADDGGLDLVAVAGVGRLEAKNPRTSLVTRPGFTIAKPGDLRGKKIAVPGINSAMDLVLRKWLIDGHVPIDQVTIVETPFAQMGDMLKSGQLDAAFAFEPLLSRILASGAAVKSLDIMSLANPDALGAFWAATRDWANTHRPAVIAFRASLAEAIAFIDAHPAEAHKIEAKYLHYSTNTLPDVSLAVTPQDFAFWARVCTEVGVLRHPVDAANLIFK
ncbi:MAG TPA: ABC transporter substrate-binding protein [Stellaceae bacterium]|nr:ABC transporter substrate-binding protein [Stellaceae bacterium]